MTLDLVARVTKGAPWPDRSPNSFGPGSAILLLGEAYSGWVWGAMAVMLAGTVGVVVGGPLALLLFGQLLPDDAWQGMAALSGSWIGGGANQTAMLEVYGYPLEGFAALLAGKLVAGVQRASVGAALFGAVLAGSLPVFALLGLPLYRVTWRVAAVLPRPAGLPTTLFSLAAGLLTLLAVGLHVVKVHLADLGAHDARDGGGDGGIHVADAVDGLFRLGDAVDHGAPLLVAGHDPAEGQAAEVLGGIGHGDARQGRDQGCTHGNGNGKGNDISPKGAACGPRHGGRRGRAAADRVHPAHLGETLRPRAASNGIGSGRGKGEGLGSRIHVSCSDHGFMVSCGDFRDIFKIARERQFLQH